MVYTWRRSCRRSRQQNLQKICDKYSSGFAIKNILASNITVITDQSVLLNSAMSRLAE
jgi:hypothetical protein